MVAAHFAFYFKASSEIWNLYQFLHCSSNPLECGKLRRIIPATHNVPAGHTPESWQPPESESEPDAWRRFTFCPVKAGPLQSSEMLKTETKSLLCLCLCLRGTAILRDNRAWHGGTPNLPCPQFTCVCFSRVL